MPSHIIRLSLIPVLALLLPLAGPVSCKRSITRAELLIEEEKQANAELELRKLETEIKALKAESAELTKTYGGTDHLTKLKQIDDLRADKANLEALKAEVDQKVTKFTNGAKAHRDYLSTQKP